MATGMSVYGSVDRSGYHFNGDFVVSPFFFASVRSPTSRAPTIVIHGVKEPLQRGLQPLWNSLILGYLEGAPFQPTYIPDSGCMVYLHLANFDGKPYIECFWEHMFWVNCVFLVGVKPTYPVGTSTLPPPSRILMGHHRSKCYSAHLVLPGGTLAVWDMWWVNVAHRIHRTNGILAYINGWSLWYMQRLI